MKCAVFSILVSLAFALPASAQFSSNLEEQTPSEPTAGLATDSPRASPLFALSAIAGAQPTGAPAGWDLAPPGEAAAPSTGVVSVFPRYSLRLYGGYTYLRFEEGGQFAPNLNGFDAGLMYYPRDGQIGANGELTLAFGTQNKKQTAKLLLAMGGPSFRWQVPRQSQIWVHALFGGSHFLPQTSFGSQSAFGYELGGGFDVKAWSPHFSYRIQADLVGTRYFGKSQFSPKIAIGLVWTF